jgi:hypothetical protein
MVLVDTSIWVFHLREGHSHLQELLETGDVLCHRFIIGELACGNIKNRIEVLTLLQAMPMIDEAEHAEVLQVIESKMLMGKGLGYIDIHLIASALLAEVPLWTLDKKLKETSTILNIHYR